MPERDLRDGVHPEQGPDRLSVQETQSRQIIQQTYRDGLSITKLI
ncbi:MAG: hypothetical protein QUS12_04060 [Methanosarcina sp.]|nr:hypothetical protein [Methanosarcina sp.]